MMRRRTLQLGDFISEERTSERGWWMGIFAAGGGPKRLEVDQGYVGRGWLIID